MVCKPIPAVLQGFFFAGLLFFERVKGFGGLTWGEDDDIGGITVRWLREQFEYGRSGAVDVYGAGVRACRGGVRAECVLSGAGVSAGTI